jgi:hypothetical protein
MFSSLLFGILVGILVYAVQLAFRQSRRDVIRERLAEIRERLELTFDERGYPRDSR